jgi:hypothetical protein
MLRPAAAALVLQRVIITTMAEHAAPVAASPMPILRAAYAGTPLVPRQSIKDVLCACAPRRRHPCPPTCVAQQASCSEVVRGIYAAYNARDIEAVMSFMDDGVEYQNANFPEPFRGKHEVRQLFGRSCEALPADMTFILDDLTEQDPLKVGILWHIEVSRNASVVSPPFVRSWRVPATQPFVPATQLTARSPAGRWQSIPAEQRVLLL